MSLFDEAISRLEWARDISSVSEACYTSLHHPKLLTEVTIPLQKDDGTMAYFTGWRCRFNDTRGPGKGGIRFHPDVNAAEVKTLAFWMTLKTALVGLPMGGGKGGIAVNTRELSETELERLSRGYVRALFPVIGPDSDVPAPDVATGPEVMGWMVDEYERIAGHKAAATFTGKAIERGGIRGRAGATARGAHHVIKAWLARQDQKDALTVAIQGFGSAGSLLAELLEKDGHKILAVSDSSGSIFNGDGLDIEGVQRAKKETGRVDEFDGGEKQDGEAVLSCDVDLLVPAALEEAIHKDNVDDIEARTIIEVANGPVSVDAERELDERGVTILPDILVNSGGVIVSWMEWVQNRSGDQWKRERVTERLHERLDRSAEAVFDRAREEGVTLRRAAYAIAMEALDI